MAELTNEEFYEKWVPLLADNVFQDIDGPRFEQLLADVRDSFASRASQNGQPVAPAVNFDPVLRQLTATHPLGTLELEYNHNNGGFTAYAPVQVDDFEHPQGEWRFRVKGDTGRNPSITTDSPLIDDKAVLNPAGPGRIKSTDISDASEAGRALLTAADAAAQRALLDELHILAGQYGAGQPQFDKLFGEEGALVYLLRHAGDRDQPAAPTNGEVNDILKEFTFKVTSAYPNYTQYKENGRPGTTAPAYLSAATAYQVGDTVHVTGLAGAAKGSLAYYVAGSGNIPDGKVLTNADLFTGAVVGTPPVSTNTPPTASVSAQVTGTSVKLTGLAVDADGVASIFLKVFDANGNPVQTFGPSVPGDTTYVTTWASGSPGVYSARAIATDSKGLPGTSDAASFTLVATTTTPDAPTVTYNSSTRRLTAIDKVSPAGTLLYSYQGSAFVEYLGAIQVDNLAHDPQEWRFKRAAATGYTESDLSYSPAIAAASSPTQAPVRRHYSEVGQSNKVDKAKTADATTVDSLLAYPDLNAAHANVEGWVPTSSTQRNTGSYKPLQNGVTDLSCSDPTDVGLNGALGGAIYPPQRGIRAGAQALRLLALFPNEIFRRITYGTNGQSFATVLDGGAYQADHDARYTAAIAQTVADGYTYKLFSCLIIYGEADQAAGNAWSTLADAYVARMIAKGFADTDTIWVIVGVKDSDGIDKSSYRAQMLAWVNASPSRRRYINPANFQGNDQDELHHNAQTQMQIGHSDWPNAVFGTTGGYRIPATVPSTDTAPVFTTFAPEQGEPGTSVALDGSNFYPAMKVYINGTLATVLSRTGTTQVVVIVPAASSTGKISLQNGTATTVSTATFTVLAATTPAASTYRRYYPRTADVGSQQLHIGSGFATNPAVVTYPGGATGTIIRQSSSELISVVPAGAGQGLLHLTGLSGDLPSTATFLPTTTGRINVFDIAEGFTTPGIPGWTQGNVFAQVNATPAVLVDGGVSLSPAANAGSNAVGIQTNGSYAMAGRIFIVNYEQYLTPLATTDLMMTVGASWITVLENGRLIGLLGGQKFNIPFDADAHRFWGMAVRGTDAYFLTSNEGVDWVTQAIVLGGAPSGNQKLCLNAACNDSTANPGTAVARLAVLANY